MHPTQARTLRVGSEALRRAQENAKASTRVSPLNDWACSVAEKRALPLPLFDPGDAGADARVLFLLESPGPMSVLGTGSGYISVDNDDATAANLWHFRHAAGLLDGAVHWNAVPWYLGRPGEAVVAPSAADLKRGARLLRELLDLLPDVEVVLPMGNWAKRAWGLHCDARPNNLAVLPTWHPSSLGLAAPGKREHVLLAVTRAAEMVTPIKAFAHHLGATHEAQEPSRAQRLRARWRAVRGPKSS